MGMTLNIWLDNQAIMVETGRFPDGAVWAKTRTELPGFADKMIVRATGLATMDDWMLLAQSVDAIRHQCDIRFSHLQLAWLACARQDRYMQTGDSFALRIFADALNSLNFDKVFVIDPHSEAAAAAVRNMVIIPQEAALLAHEPLRTQLKSGELMLVAPDAGSLKKIHAVAAAAGAQDFAIMTKNRDVATGRLTGFALASGDVAGKDLLIADDLCDAGGTFIGSAQVLLAAGARSVSLYVTHGIFSKGVENLLSQGIKHIYTTTSFSAQTQGDSRLSVVDIDTLFVA